MKRLTMICLVICFSLSVFGQNKKKDQEVEIVNHEVQLGESVRLISKKYLVDPAEIYKLNKFAVEGISQGMVLKIPVPKKESVIAQQEENPAQPEIVSPAETQKAIEEKKPAAETVQKTAEPTAVVRTSAITYTVEPKETLYSLSKKFGISVDELKSYNPQLDKGLKIGQVIRIPATTDNGENIDAVPEQTTSVSAESPNVVTHTVAPKETLYSLSKKYNVSVDEIKQQNEVLLQHGLQIGQVLTIRKN
jgi:LysM repeat protein